MKHLYAHDVGDRLIPIGDAWRLSIWYAQPSPRKPLIVLQWKCREELLARLVCGALLMAFGIFMAVQA